MESRAEGRSPQKAEGLPHWNGPPLDLFPSRVYGDNGRNGGGGTHMLTPMDSCVEQYTYRTSPPQDAYRASPPQDAYRASPPQEAYRAGSPQEFLRSPSVHPKDIHQPSGVHSWERFSHSISSVQDRTLEPPRRGSPRHDYPSGEAARSTREWVAVTAYQPVDVVTRTVEVPVTRTVDVYVPKPVVREKIVEVPKFVPKYIEKIVEVPQVEWVERVVEVPEVVYNTKIVPKVEIRENIVEKPVFHQKWVEKIVEVSVVEEVIRYRTIHEPEEIIKYVPRGHHEEEWRGAPILTVPPHQTPELPPKWGGTPQPSPRHPLVQAATQRAE